MATLASLKRQASSAARFRGHNLRQWSAPYPGHAKTLAYADCSTLGCQAWVQVDTKPPANGIDVVGPAVAMGCPYREKEVK